MIHFRARKKIDTALMHVQYEAIHTDWKEEETETVSLGLSNSNKYSNV